MIQVYLAGFDVFAPDAKQRGAEQKRHCAERGMIGLYPLDNEANTANAIFAGNCALIDRADAVLANGNPFRGMEPDSGTAFEIGYAFAKGKKVYVYLDDTRSLREKIGTADADGFAVEDFSMPLNLMLGCAATVVHGGFAEALERLKADMG